MLAGSAVIGEHNHRLRRSEARFEKTIEIVGRTPNEHHPLGRKILTQNGILVELRHDDHGASAVTELFAGERPDHASCPVIPPAHDCVTA